MKVKILDVKLQSYWYSDRIGEELTVNYNIYDIVKSFTTCELHHYITNADAVITELPESFCVKRCHDDKEKWEKYIQWLSNKYVRDLDGFINKYYGVRDNYTFGKDVIFGTEIHIDDIIKHIDYMETKDSITVKYENGKLIEVKEEFNMNTVDGRLAYAKKHYPIGCTVIEVSGEKFKSKVKEIHTSVNNSIKLQFGAGLLYNNITGEWAEIIKEEINMETQKLSRQGLKEIHGVACLKWKNILKTYGLRNPLEDYIDLTQGEVNQMFDACTPNQLVIVSKYLKKGDGSVGLSFINNKNLLQESYDIIGIIGTGDYAHKSFWLTDRYNWEIKTDSAGRLCLIPTKKK